MSSQIFLGPRGHAAPRSSAGRSRVRPARRPYIGLLLLGLAVLAPTRAHALDFAGGVSAGAVYLGTRAAPAVTPHLGVSWQADRGFLLVLQDMLNILPATNRDGVGVYNHLTAGLGYGWDDGSFSVGVALPAYFVPVCRNTLCGRVAGIGFGGYGRVSVFLAGPLGLSVNANVDWLGGSSAILQGGAAVMVVAGPVIRW